MKNGMTCEQHIATGVLLKSIRLDLMKLHRQVSTSYKFRGHGAKAMTSLTRAVDKLNLARSSLEELAFRDCGLGFSLDVYNGNKQGSHGPQL